MPERDPESGKFLSSGAAVADPPPETKKPEPKQEEQDTSGMEAMARALVFDERVKPDEKKPEKPKAKEPEKPKAKVAPVAKPKVQPTAPALTTDQIAAAVEEGTARALKPKAKEEADPVDEVPDNLKRRLGVLEQMEKLYPDRYKGVAKRYQSAHKKLAEYAKKWETDHPGESFDEDNEEHAPFIEGVNKEASWDDDDYTEALAEQRAQKLVAKEREEINSKLSAFERDKQLRDAGPSIYREQGKAANDFWKQFGEDFKDLILPNGDANMEKIKALREKDPTAYDLRQQYAEALDLEVAELHKLLGVNGGKSLIEFDPKNPIHTNLTAFTLAQEQRMAARPVEDQINNENQAFLPSDKYWKLSKADRARHWTFDANALAAIRAKQLADVVQKTITDREAEHQAWAKARGLKEPEKQVTTEETKPVEEPEPIEPADAKPESPTISGESKMAAERGAGKKGQQDGLTSFILRGI